MPTVYLRSTDGANADDGSTWALAKANLAEAVIGAIAVAAGGRIYASQAHTGETYAASTTFAFSTDPSAPSEVICANDGAEPPTAVATTAVVAVTGANLITITGFLYCYGVTWQVGSGTSSNTPLLNLNTGSLAPGAMRFSNCSLQILSTGTNSRINVGSTGSASTDDEQFDFETVTFVFGNASQGIRPAGRSRFRGCTFAGSGTVPTALFLPAGGTDFYATVEDSDIANLGSGKALVQVGTTSTKGIIIFNRCKLGASVAVTTGAPTGPGSPIVWLINCDSGATIYRNEYYDYTGSWLVDTGVYRTGGANDNATSYSVKMVTSGKALFTRPLYGPWFKVWNDTTGSNVTVEIEIVSDGITFTDREIGMEVRELGTAGFPQGVQVLDRAADILATAANQSASSETWTTTGLTTPVTQKLSATFTPTLHGWVMARVILMRTTANTTVYVCPKILSTSTYQQFDDTGAVINGPNLTGGGGGETFTGSQFNRGFN